MLNKIKYLNVSVSFQPYLFSNFSFLTNNDIWSLVKHEQNIDNIHSTIYSSIFIFVLKSLSFIADVWKLCAFSPAASHVVISFGDKAKSWDTVKLQMASKKLFKNHQIMSKYIVIKVKYTVFDWDPKQNQNCPFSDKESVFKKKKTCFEWTKFTRDNKLVIHK